MVLLCAFPVEILTIWQAEALMSVFWLYQYYSRCFSSFSLHIQFFPPSFLIVQLFLLSFFFHKCPVPSILLMVPRSFFFCFYSWTHGHGMKGLNVYVCVCVCAQSFPTLCNPMDHSPPGSSVQGIFREQVPAPWNTGVGYHFLLQGIFLTQDRTHVSRASCIGCTTAPSPFPSGNSNGLNTIL